MRQSRELIHHTSRESLGCVEHDMKQSNDELDKIIKVDVWLHAYQPKKKAGDEVIEYADSRLTKLEMDLQRMKMKIAALLPQLGQGDNSSENNNVAIPTNQLINSTSDMSISKKRKEDENISISSKVVTSSKGVKKRKQGEKNGDMSVSKKRKKVENVLISSRHVTSSKGEKKRKESEKNGDMSISKKRKKLKIFRFLPNMLHARKLKRREEKVRSFAPQMQQLHLLSWYGEEEKIVATADLVSKDPTDKVHCVPLGRGCWKVWVREVFEDIALMRPTLELSTLSAAKGSLVAWPITSIKLL